MNAHIQADNLIRTYQMFENILTHAQTLAFTHTDANYEPKTRISFTHTCLISGFVFQTLYRFGASGGTNLESLRSAIAVYIFSADVFLLSDVCYALPFDVKMRAPVFVRLMSRTYFKCTMYGNVSFCANRPPLPYLLC